MPSFDENSHSVDSYTVRSYDIMALLDAVWSPFVAFNLRIVKRISVRLKK